MSCGREEGRGRGRRWGWQELNNLLCYWLMLHCRHLELIAALFSFPLYSCTLLRETLSRLSRSLPTPTVCSWQSFRPIFLWLHLCKLSCLSMPDTSKCMCVLHVLKLSVTQDITTCGSEWAGSPVQPERSSFSRAVTVLAVFVKLHVVK